MSQEVRNCPFCGPQEPELWYYFKGEASRNYAVCCYNCRAQGPWAIGQEAAVTAWNRRADPAPQPATSTVEVEAVVGFIHHDRADRLQSGSLVEQATIFRNPPFPETAHRYIGLVPASVLSAALEDKKRAEEDVADLRKEAAFLLDRLDDLERGWDDDEAYREFAGHVTPSIARLRMLLASPALTKERSE